MLNIILGHLDPPETSAPDSSVSGFEPLSAHHLLHGAFTLEKAMEVLAVGKFKLFDYQYEINRVAIDGEEKIDVCLTQIHLPEKQDQAEETVRCILLQLAIRLIEFGLDNLICIEATNYTPLEARENLPVTQRVWEPDGIDMRSIIGHSERAQILNAKMGVISGGLTSPKRAEFPRHLIPPHFLCRETDCVMDVPLGMIVDTTNKQRACFDRRAANFSLIGFGKLPGPDELRLEETTINWHLWDQIETYMEKIDFLFQRYRKLNSSATTIKTFEAFLSEYTRSV